MKKLMLAAAIVCAAVAAQAQLTISNVNLGYINVPSGFTVASKCCDMYAYKTDSTQSQLVKNDLVWSVTQTPPFMVNQWNFSWEGGTGSVADYKYYWVFTYTLSDGSSKTLSTLGSGLYYDIFSSSFIENSLYEEDWTSYTSNASNWKGGEVPEPTSAMLMLLGVAGLALKRRRA